jgi:hypothetical protein
MRIKKYLTKENIKQFLTSVTLDFVFITLMLFVLSNAFGGGFPKPMGTWLAIILAYSIGDAIRHMKTMNKVDDVSELAKGNYWKLKKELRTKVTKQKSR